MSDLETSYAKLLGRQPTDSERQTLYRIKDALNLPNNDALWLVLMALQYYETLYAGIPGRISEAAQAAAGSSAAQAQSEISTAVAALVPTVESAVGKAAAGAVNNALNRVQLGRSIFTAWGAAVVIGLGIGIGWLFGSHILGEVQVGKLTWNDFWHATRWGIGIGLAAPAFLLIGLFVRNDYGDVGGIGWGAIIISVVLMVIMGLSLYGVI